MCEITIDRRKNCRACRWNSCIAAGQSCFIVQIFDFQYNTQSIGMKISYVQFDARIAGNGNTFEEVNI